MNPEFATAYNAFQSKNQHFQRRNSRLSRTQRTWVHIAQGRLQQLYNKSSGTVTSFLI
jgi:uncharacterized protein YecT (DUF1311 family)